MKILVTSDWHLDWSTAGISRWSDLELATIEIVDAAVKQKVDEFFFLGDLCDPDRSASGTLSAISRAIHIAGVLESNQIPSTWLVGNHDVVEDGRNTSTLSPLHAQQSAYIHVIAEPCVVPLGENAELNLMALPYTARSHAYDPEQFVDETAAKVDIVIGHLNIEGIGPGSETTDLPRGRDVFFPLAAVNRHFPNALKMNGHYHTRQTHEGIHIPGSLERLTFGEEENEPGYFIVEV